MKRVFAVLVLAFLVAGGAFAQSGEAKNWISGQASLLGGGVQYERVLTPKFSVGADVYFNSFFIIFNNLGVEAMGRYYIWQGLYAQMGLGFGLRTGIDSSYYDTAYVVRGFLLDPAAGWKIDLGRPGGFFIEPLVSVPIVLGKKDYDWFVDDKDKFGVGVGVRIAFGMGYAF